MSNVRKIKFEDHWRRVYKRQYPLNIKNITMNGGKIFDGLALSLQPGINAIVGKNGTGKSNFVRSLYNVLASDGSNRKKFAHLLDSSVLLVEMQNGKDVKVINSISSSGEEVEDFICFIFDPCSLIPEIQKLFSSQENLHELLEAYEARRLSSSEIRLVNYVTNSQYSKIDVFNIEDEYEDFPRLPFFVVERGQFSYDSRSMGLGELSLLYLFWLIDRVLRGQEHSILLIEEPESFLPPLIQNRVSDVLAMISAERGVSCVLSTHSEHITKKVPRSHIHIMGNVQAQIRFMSATSDFEHMNVLGLSAPKRGILFFEDKAASILARCMIKMSAEYVADSFHYSVSGSEANVLSQLKNFPKDLTGFSMIAIFDGDCRGKFEKDLMGFNQYIYLPSRSPPEEILIELLNQKEVSLMASHLGVTIEKLSMAIEAAAGADHHDYFRDLSRSLGVDFDILFYKLCEVWVGEKNNEVSVKEFLAELGKLIV